MDVELLCTYPPVDEEIVTARGKHHVEEEVFQSESHRCHYEGSYDNADEVAAQYVEMIPETKILRRGCHRPYRSVRP